MGVWQTCSLPQHRPQLLPLVHAAPERPYGTDVEKRWRIRFGMAIALGAGVSTLDVVGTTNFGRDPFGRTFTEDTQRVSYARLFD